MKALVPLDGSEFSLSVLPNVRRLAELAPGLEVHLLTVVDPKSVHGQSDHPARELASTLPGSKFASALAPVPRVVESHGEALQRMRIDAIEALQAISSRDLVGLTACVDVVFSSNPAAAITDKTNAVGADLIIMATHGRSGFSHLLTGSVTEAVIRSSDKPVLVSCPKSAASSA